MNKLESAPLYHNKRRLVINMWSSSYIDKIIFRRPEAVICVFIEIVRTSFWSYQLASDRYVCLVNVGTIKKTQDKKNTDITT